MNKIIHQFQLQVIYSIVFLLTGLSLNAQKDTTVNQFGVRVIGSRQQLEKNILGDPAKALVDIKERIPGIVVDLRYAGTRNFMHQQLYPSVSTTYLRKPVADALALAQKELNKKGLGLKIFDAYRPYSISKKIWDLVKDERYAASPKKGSRHNRGIAVDLTLINLTSNEELNMGTDFDNFSDSAHHAFTRLPATVLQNRRLLRSTMQKYGFEAQTTEWWHYSIHHLKYFEVLDISFTDLAKINH